MTVFKKNDFLKKLRRGKDLDNRIMTSRKGEKMNIEESLNFLVETIAEIKFEILELKTKSDLRAYALKEIAQGLGYSIQTLRNYPWKIPNYGKPDEGSCPGKWFYTTIKKWYEIPENERRLKWESMSSMERRKITGKN